MGGNEHDRVADALSAMAGGAAPTSRDPGESGAAKPQAVGGDGAGGGDDSVGDDRLRDDGVPDEQVAAPAPDASVFAPRQSTHDLLEHQRVEQKRTIIPVLLTCG